MGALSPAVSSGCDKSQSKPESLPRPGTVPEPSTQKEGGGSAPGTPASGQVWRVTQGKRVSCRFLDSPTWVQSPAVPCDSSPVLGGRGHSPAAPPLCPAALFPRRQRRSSLDGTGRGQSSYQAPPRQPGIPLQLSLPACPPPPPSFLQGAIEQSKTPAGSVSTSSGHDGDPKRGGESGAQCRHLSWGTPQSTVQPHAGVAGDPKLAF